MNNSEWLKTSLIGAAVGAVALAVIGFSLGGWMTGGTAQKVASDQARKEVVAALVPICLEQSKQDPQSMETLALLKAANSYERSDMLMKAGWATMPGSTDPNSGVARACIAQLATQF